jgi:hypothetical protein
MNASESFVLARISTGKRPPKMTKEEAIEKAKGDLATRLGIEESQIAEQSVSDADFPDMALGAAAYGEMSGQMITKGWRIQLGGGGNTYEYRADKTQLRLYKFKGKNYKI